MFEDWEVEEVAPGTVLAALDGKLRGSRARQLADRLGSLADRRAPEIARVILDLRQVVSIDSIGIVAFEEALERGLKLDLVLRRGFELDDGREATELSRRGLRVHSSLDVALASRRSARVAAASA